jgi:heme/copper-type cytochrome/quinol oxidase subunit 4
MALIFFIIFLISTLYLMYMKKKDQGKIKAQFFIETALIMLIFYIVSIISGICTIISFIWEYFF